MDIDESRTGVTRGSFTTYVKDEDDVPLRDTGGILHGSTDRDGLTSTRSAGESGFQTSVSKSMRNSPSVTYTFLLFMSRVPSL